MLIGYNRTSTVEQLAGFEAQRRDLEKVGCEKIFSEQVSSVAQRAQLEAAIDFAREGDVFVVTNLSRLARSVADLCRLVERLKAKGVALRVLDTNIDTNTASGKLILHVIGAIAEFERQIMLERQREGIAKAKAEGKYKGQAPTARRQANQIIALARAGKTKQAIADELSINIRSVFRILKDVKTAARIEAAPISQSRSRPRPQISGPAI